MNYFGHDAKSWLSAVLAQPFKATKHVHSHQDEVYKIETPNAVYYLKISATLTTERDNLKRLASILRVPEVIDFHESKDGHDYLLISGLPGKNLVELIGDWSNLEIVGKFAEAIKQLHSLDASRVFPEASSKDVLLHGDMALPNIIISDEGKLGYIDFGQLSFGTPELDLVDAIWSLQRNLGSAYGEQFLQAYGSVAMTPKIKAALAFRHEESAAKQL